MKILAVIPARYNSQRLPGKPLALIGSKPMIQRVYEGTKQCEFFNKVIVATDDDRIKECVESFEGVAMLTDTNHSNGTERVAEVAQRFPEADIIVNIQGDQPFITSDILTELIHPYLNNQMPDMVTLACPLNEELDYTNPNVVKVICSTSNKALYFSRAAIPYYRTKLEAPVYQHLGLYAFTREFLLKYVRLEPTPLEQCEGLEQLRALEHGYNIVVRIIKESIMEINTPEDLVRTELKKKFI